MIVIPCCDSKNTASYHSKLISPTFYVRSFILNSFFRWKLTALTVPLIKSGICNIGVLQPHLIAHIVGMPCHVV